MISADGQIIIAVLQIDGHEIGGHMGRRHPATRDLLGPDRRIPAHPIPVHGGYQQILWASPSGRLLMRSRLVGRTRRSPAAEHARRHRRPPRAIRGPRTGIEPDPPAPAAIALQQLLSATSYRDLPHAVSADLDADGADLPTDGEGADLPVQVCRESSIRRRRPCVSATRLRNIAPPAGCPRRACLLTQPRPTARNCPSGLSA